MPPPPLPGDVRRGLPVLIAGRLVSNTGIRFVYPFLPAIARGLGVSPDTAGLALSIRELSGVAAPAAGRAVDRGRRRAGLVLGLLGCGLALIVAGASPGVVVFTIAVTAFGVSKMGYDTAMSTWIGDHVPWERRGTVVGLGELSWAGAILIGVPLLGLVIDTWGWRAAFVAVGLANATVALVVPRLIAADPPRGSVIGGRLRLLPGAIGIYVTMTLLSFGIQLVIVVYGYWLEDDFGWSVSTIGLASILLGVGELTGTGLTITFADRIGKRNALLLGAILLAPLLALLGTAGDNGLLGIAMLGAAVCVYELAFVSGLPLITEIDPDARGAGVGVAIALVTIGRSVATFVGTALYVRIGMGWTGVIAAGVISVAATVTLVAVREPTSRR